MPRKGDATYVPNRTAADGGFVPVPLNLIHDDIAKEAEEAYELLKTSPNGNVRVAFDLKSEADEYALLLKSYCVQRPDGELRFRRSPIRPADPTVCAFRITDVPDETETRESESVIGVPLKGKK